MDPIDMLRRYVLLERAPTPEERSQATAALLILQGQRAAYEAVRAAARRGQS